jgi:excisionase family DNA binding protein
MSQPVVILTPNEFDRLISEVKSHLSKQVEGIKGTIIEKPMCVKQACEYLGIHENTLYKRMRSGVIPPGVVHRVDGTLYFFASELFQFIKKS